MRVGSESQITPWPFEQVFPECLLMCPALCRTFQIQRESPELASECSSLVQETVRYRTVHMVWQRLYPSYAKNTTENEKELL